MKHAINLLAICLFGVLPCQAEDSGNVQSENQTTASTVPKRAFLGLGLTSLPPALASHLPDLLADGRGVMVSEVTKGSPAEQAGIQKHDILLRYDDQDLYSAEQFAKRVRNDEPGKSVMIEFVRRGKKQSVEVTLGQREQRAPITGNWPGLVRRFDVPLNPSLRNSDEIDPDLTERWTKFESMSVQKTADGDYVAKVTFRGDQNETVSREYKGTRQEVRDAIEADEELPDHQKQRLLQSVEGKSAELLPDLNFLPNWRTEMLDWPGLDF